MKKLLLSIVFIAFSQMMFSQTSGGPDQYGYIWRDSNDSLGPVYSWIDITQLPGAVQVSGLADDNTSIMYQMGFQFPYYWYHVDEFIVGSNGYIIFNNGAISSPFPTIPLQLLPNDFIGAFMTDLNFGGSGNVAECWYWTNNSDSLVVSYINVPFWVNNVPPYDGANTFQIILNASDSSITFQYADQQSTTPGTGTFLSIGIENTSGAIGLQQSVNTYPVPPYAVRFYYPDSATYVVADAATIYNDNAETGGLFLSKDGNAFNLSTVIGNSGNQTIDTVPVTMEVLSSSGSSVLFVNDTAFGLAPQATQAFNPSQSFAPTAVDVYSFRTQTHLNGDLTSGNDRKDLKLTVVDTTQVLIPLCYTGPVEQPLGEGISWTGGDAGVGVEIIPPFFPCYVHKMEFYITVNNNPPSGFYGLIYDNTGLNGGPGTLLDSIYMPPASVITGTWNTMVLTNPLLVNSGSLFVEWRMGGEGIAIGADTTHPVSNRSYEVLGSWSILRYRELEDPMIRLQISAQAVTSAEEITNEGFAGNFYPSPSNNSVKIELNKRLKSKDIYFEFFDLKGQLIYSEKFSAEGIKYTFNTGNFPQGVHTCRITAGDEQITRRLVVMH